MAKIRLNAGNKVLTDPVTGLVMALPGADSVGTFSNGFGCYAVTSSSFTVKRSDIFPQGTPGRNGMSLNVGTSGGQEPDHGFDDRVVSYSAIEEITGEVEVSPGDCLIITESLGSLTGETHTNFYSIIHILDAAPSATTVTPGCFGHDGNGTRPTFEVDWGAVVDSLPTYDFSGYDGDFLETPAERAVEAGYFIPAPLCGRTKGRDFVPLAGGLADGYGPSFARNAGRWMFEAIGNRATRDQKIQILKYASAQAHSWYRGRLAGNGIDNADGGINQGYIAPIQMLLGAAGEPLATMNTNETKQAGEVDAALLAKMAPHDVQNDATHPQFSLRRQVVEVNGNAIKLPRLNAANLAEVYQDCDLIAESGGARMTITDDGGQIGNGETTIDLVLASHSLSVNDWVYGDPIVPFTLGQMYYSEKGYDDLAKFNASSGPQYMALQAWQSIVILAAMNPAWVSADLYPALKLFRDMRNNHPRYGASLAEGFDVFDEWYAAHGETVINAALPS